MTAPPGYANKYRANINVELRRNQSHHVKSPNAMWQDGQWHSYEIGLEVLNYIESPLMVGIEVDFDGPDGGGWFWTWKTIWQPGED